VGDKRLQKQIDKLETAAEQLAATADELRDKAAAKAERLSDRATSRAAELLDIEQEEPKGRKGLVALLLAAAGGAAFALKRKREQELDEALWEEPRDL
jgi:hypothetical protein